MKTKNIYIILVVMLITICAVIFVNFRFQRSKSLLSPQNTYQVMTINNPSNRVIFPNSDTTIQVDIASTNEEIRQGLSGRELLPEDKGMLFDLGYQNTYPSFWMIDMNFDLDIIWLADNVIVQIHKNVPAPQKNTPPSELPLYSPDMPVDQILEVNAGFTDRYNIKVGDPIELIVVSN